MTYSSGSPELMARASEMSTPPTFICCPRSPCRRNWRGPNVAQAAVVAGEPDDGVVRDVELLQLGAEVANLGVEPSDFSPEVLVFLGEIFGLCLIGENVCGNDKRNGSPQPS